MDDYAADSVELDTDAEGELKQQGGSPGVTLVDAGGLHPSHTFPL
jgi:hypothetical protein